MPTLGEGFLESLRNPPVNQGLFNLGAAVGGVPGQYRAKQKKDTRATELLNVAQGSSDFYTLLSKHALEDGDTLKAAELDRTSKKLQREKVLEGRADTEYTDKQASKTADSAYRLTTLADILKRPDLTTAQKAKALNLEKSLKAAKGKEGEALKNSYKAFIDKVAPEVYDYSSLLKEFTPTTVSAFKKSVKLGTPNYGLLVRKDPTKTTSAPQYKEMLDPVTKEKGLYLMRGATPIYVGPVEKDPYVMSASEADTFNDIRTERSVARNQVSNYNRLAAVADDTSWNRGGLVGSAMDKIEEAAGIQGQAALHRADLNNIQVSGALAMLPQGPASDKDVALAMSTQVNLNNLSPEQAASYLRGMAKIAKAREAFLEKKLQYIEVTKDANALGFDAWAATQGAQKSVDEMVSKLGSSVQNVRDSIQSISKMQDKQAQLKAISALKNSTQELTGGYSLSDVYTVLAEQQQATNRWNAQKATNNKLEGFY
jgi:hypothetical protein